MISEPITQQQHAFQTYLAMKRTSLGSKSVDLRVSALLHDIGHLLHGKPKDPAQGVNDFHELIGAKWLAYHGFPPAVYMPIMGHVDAKRYLCAKNPKYGESLTEGSRLSLRLQGGPMADEELKDFENSPYFQETLLLRQCDEAGKDVDLAKNHVDLRQLEAEVYRSLEIRSPPKPFQTTEEKQNDSQ